ncbi:protein of unknown function [Burkholderia multivorans]
MAPDSINGAPTRSLKRKMKNDACVNWLRMSGVARRPPGSAHGAPRSDFRNMNYAPKTKNPLILPNQGASYFGGEGGIRTHGTGKPYA